MTRRRWVCPECGTGKLGPEKPRKNNVIRHCLPCSEKAGVLVERSCPALDNKRAEKAQRRAEKRARKAKTEARKRLEARVEEKRRRVYDGDPAWLPYMIGGIDYSRLWAQIFRYLKIERPNLHMGAERRSIGRLGVNVARPVGGETKHRLIERQLYQVIWCACLHASHYGRYYADHVERHGRRRELNSLAGDIAVNVLGLDKGQVYEAVANYRSVTWGIVTKDDVIRLQDLPRLAKALRRTQPSARALTQRACLDEKSLVLLDLEIERMEAA